MSVPFRIVICKLDHAYTNSAQGLVEALFEKIGDFYYPINQMEFFCETQSVFITKGYDEIEEKYSNQLFELKVFPSRNELKDGDCKYISTIESSSPVTSNFACAEIIECQPPEANSPNVTVDKYPLTSSLFFYWSGQLHGPFNIVDRLLKINSPSDIYNINLETKSIEIKSSDGRITLPSYHYFSVDESKVTKFITTTIKNEPRRFISCVRDVMDQVDSNSMTDFISDDTIITRYGSIIASSAQIRNFTKGHIRLIKDQVNNLKEYRLNKPRFTRLFELFEQPETWSRERSSILEEFFDSEKGVAVLNSYLENNKEALLADKLGELQKEISDKAEELNSSIKELTDKKHDLEASIRSKKQELQSLEEEDQSAKVKLTAQEKSNLDIELKEHRLELERLKTELSELKITHSAYKDFDELKREAQDLRGSIRLSEKEIEALEAQKKRISKEIEDENNELLSKLVDLKPKVDMLSGVLPTEKYQTICFNNKTNYKPKSYDVGEQQEILDNISDQLLSHGRKLDFEDLTNVVVSLAQTQFTLFSGLPGTGKTSLAKLLGRAMGLENRLLNIPVARGWTSQRDVIGFYNTLSQSYVPSTTGLYDLLCQIQDKDDGNNNSASIILLDEFNLSQPEHYFSPFMEMADPESNRTVYTGDPKKPQLNLPHYVRFLGTINNDESVQSVTPRMLDRSAVIHFDDIITSSSISGNEHVEVRDSKKILSGNDFIKIFNRENHSIPQEISTLLDDITRTLNDDNPMLGNQVIVSYRKIKAICNYYNVASPLMIGEKIMAFDYAVSQHIIPLINGYGEGFGTRLKSLLATIPSDMTKTRKRLNRIISVGEQNLNTYGAFL